MDLKPSSPYAQILALRQKVADLENQAARLTSRMPDISWETDGAFLYTAVSAGIKEFGYAPEDFIGQPLGYHVWPEDMQRISREILFPAVKKQREHPDGPLASVFEVRHETAAGDYRWIEVNAGFKLDDTGTIIGITGISRDITEKKAAEKARADLQQQLFELQRLEHLATVILGVVHNFRNLLTVISGNATLLELLLEELPETAITNREEALNCVKDIVVAAKNGADLSQTIQTLFRPQLRQTDKQPLTELPTHLHESFAPLVQSTAEVNYFFAQTPLITVPLTATDLNQCLLNLVINAKQALGNRPDGNISLSLKLFHPDAAFSEKYPFVKDGDYAEICVSDNGPGMTTEVAEKAFLPFFTTKQATKGTGLGLATVYNIIKNAGGYVLLETTPGQGAKFTLLLPTI